MINDLNSHRDTWVCKHLEKSWAVNTEITIEETTYTH